MIRITTKDGRRLKFNDGQWTALAQWPEPEGSVDESFSSLLQSIHDDWVTSAVAGYTPNFEVAAALAMIKEFGGKITSGGNRVDPELPFGAVF